MIFFHQIMDSIITYQVDLSKEPSLPFPNAVCVSSQLPEELQKSVLIKKISREVFVGSKRLEIIQYEGQKNGCVAGETLMSGLLRENCISPPASLLDFFIEHPEFWPESWKDPGMWVYFFGTEYQGSYKKSCYRRGYWEDGKVVSGVNWKVFNFGRNHYTAVLI